jgi:hypothetical protein
MNSATPKTLHHAIILSALWILIGALSRILPHIPDVTALTSVSLLAGMQFSRIRALLIVTLTLLLSDAILAYQSGYAIFGSWTFFTYSGFILIASISKKFNPLKNRYFLGFIISASLVFWLWTNFGVWLYSGIYPLTASGLAFCYSAALPFLRNAIIGDIIWLGVLLSIQCGVKKTCHVPHAF